MMLLAFLDRVIVAVFDVLRLRLRAPRSLEPSGIVERHLPRPGAVGVPGRRRDVVHRRRPGVEAGGGRVPSVTVTFSIRPRRLTVIRSFWPTVAFASTASRSARSSSTHWPLARTSGRAEGCEGGNHRRGHQRDRALDSVERQCDGYQADQPDHSEVADTGFNALVVNSKPCADSCNRRVEHEPQAELGQWPDAASVQTYRIQHNDR